MEEFAVEGRTALRAEVVGRPAAIARAIRNRRLPALGEGERLRFAFDRHVVAWKSRLHAEQAAAPLLAAVALAQGDALWVGSVVGEGELSAVARARTRGHLPLLASGPGCADATTLRTTLVWSSLRSRECPVVPGVGVEPTCRRSDQRGLSRSSTVTAGGPEWCLVGLTRASVLRRIRRVMLRDAPL